MLSLSDAEMYCKQKRVDATTRSIHEWLCHAHHSIMSCAPLNYVMRTTQLCHVHHSIMSCAPLNYVMRTTQLCHVHVLLSRAWLDHQRH